MWELEKRSVGVSEYWSIGGTRNMLSRKEPCLRGEDVFVSEVELDVNSDDLLFHHSSTHYCITPKLQRSITPVSLPKPASSPRAHLASKTVAA